MAPPQVVDAAAESAAAAGLTDYLLEQVKAGADLHMSIGRGVMRYPLSSHMAQCKSAAQATLFAACRDALNGYDAAAAQRLKAFARIALGDFATEYIAGAQ